MEPRGGGGSLPLLATICAILMFFTLIHRGHCFCFPGVDLEIFVKVRVLQKYFLLEQERVKSLLYDIVSNGRLSDSSTVYKIQSVIHFMR